MLLRFDAGDERIHTTQNFRVFDSGGEYNVARNLAKVFQQKTAIVTALADNGLGRLAENLILQGVNTSEILWRAHDGTRTTEQAQIRATVCISSNAALDCAPASAFDRANTAVSQLRTGDVDWEKILVEQKVRWLHTGGIFVGLSESTPDVALEAMQAARANGTIVSYDLNYRDSLWKERGGREEANRVNFGVPDFNANLRNSTRTISGGRLKNCKGNFRVWKLLPRV